MSNKPADENAPDEDAGDVTEIVPTSNPESDNSNPDATQILPMRTAAQPKQDLPGTVIGVAGTQPKEAAHPQTNAPQERASNTSAPDDNDATKILFETPASKTGGADEDIKSDVESTGPLADDGTTSQPSNASTLSEAASQPKHEPTDPVDGPASEADKTVFLTPVSKSKSQDDFNPPVGWLVIIDGPGRGSVADIRYGQNKIGRGEDQHIVLNFGDKQITRDTHAYLLYDEIERTYFLRDAGQQNLVRINKNPVMKPTKLNSHDHIQIGQTTCLFVPLCNDVFDWLGGEDDPATGPPGESKSG